MRTANNFKRNFLKKDPKYELVFRYINYRKDHPKNINYNRPKILDISSHKNINETTEEYWNRINKHTINMTQQSKPKVTCTYCHSTNTKKISGLSKAGSVALFGIFSQKVKHQWHCNECGSDF